MSGVLTIREYGEKGCITFTELLESQERAQSVDFAPWEALAKWLCLFSKKTGLIPGDCNLRNFIAHRAPFAGGKRKAILILISNASFALQTL